MTNYHRGGENVQPSGASTPRRNECHACGHRFEGLATHCPRCETPIPQAASAPIAPTPLSHPAAPGTGWTKSRRLSGLQITVSVFAAFTVGLLVLGLFAWLSFVLHFCIDFAPDDGVDECAGQEQAGSRLMLSGMFVAIGTVGLVIWGLLALFGRRNRRQNVQGPAPGIPSEAPSMRPARRR